MVVIYTGVVPPSIHLDPPPCVRNSVVSQPRHSTGHPPFNSPRLGPRHLGLGQEPLLRHVLGHDRPAALGGLEHRLRRAGLGRAAALRLLGLRHLDGLGRTAPYRVEFDRMECGGEKGWRAVLTFLIRLTDAACVDWPSARSVTYPCLIEWRAVPFGRCAVAEGRGAAVVKRRSRGAGLSLGSSVA